MGKKKSLLLLPSTTTKKITKKIVALPKASKDIKIDLQLLLLHYLNLYGNIFYYLRDLL